LRKRKGYHTGYLMRIIVDYRPALRARTGVGEYIRQLVRAYTAHHTDDVAVFTSSWKDRPASTLGEELGVAVIDRQVPVALLNYLWHRLGWPPIDVLAGRADVVHAAHPLLIPSRHAAQVVTIHDLFFLDHPDRVRDEIRRDYPALAADHARRADAVITSSVRTLRLIVERLGVAEERVYCCPPGAPVWRTLGHSPHVPPDGYVLLLGTLEARKNVGVILDAFARLVQAGSAPKLVVAGSATADATEWLARAAQPPLASHVQYVGYVPDQRREDLFAGARALVLPSLDEGFGLTALEAMSAGVPLIASNRGSLPEVVGSGGLLLEPHDAEAWTMAIDRATHDDAWARELACAGLERSKAFTWERTAARLGQAYQDAVARRGSRQRT
jgi:glycosyltransferase involved in cell wall biosynthesis